MSRHGFRDTSAQVKTEIKKYIKEEPDKREAGTKRGKYVAADKSEDAGKNAGNEEKAKKMRPVRWQDGGEEHN